MPKARMPNPRCPRCGQPAVVGFNISAGRAAKGDYRCRVCCGAWQKGRTKRRAKQPSVYVLTHPRIRGRVKVGKTDYPEHRLSSYNSSCPDRAYRYAVVVSAEDMGTAERCAHRLLKAYHHSHEWFSCSIETAAAAVHASVL